MEVHMDRKDHTRTDLADRKIELLVLGISLLTAIIELLSKVVNYARRVPELRLQLQSAR
jgi:hypothetical protein